jgi:hypothetical protein
MKEALEQSVNVMAAHLHVGHVAGVRMRVRTPATYTCIVTHS